MQYFRPGWDDYFMAIVRIVATRSTCDRLRAGAVLVKDNRIISTGYNGSPTGQPHCDGEAGHLMEEGHCVRTIHAEHNAILQAAIVPGMSTDGATLYTKYSPCIHCAKYIIAAKIKRVIIAKFYRNAQVPGILKAAGIEVEIYKENPAWNAVVKNLFDGEIPEVIPKEGVIKLNGLTAPSQTNLSPLP
jgi:dCMP deaminase